MLPKEVLHGAQTSSSADHPSTPALCVNMLPYTRRVRYRSGQGGDTRSLRDAQTVQRIT